MQTKSGDGDAVRIKLDFERQCYRHAEMIARQRLELLQASVGRTIKAIQRNNQDVWHQAQVDRAD